MSQFPSNIYTGNETYTASQLQSYADPAFLSAELRNMGNQDMINKPLKYAKPKYIEETETYKVLKPITKEAVELPTKRSNKIKTTKAVYQAPIYVDGKEQLNQLLNDQNFGYDSNIPLPTQSTINNLCTASLFQPNASNYYSEPQVSQTSSKINNSKFDPNIYQSKQLISTSKKSYNQSKYSLQNTIDEEIPKPIF